MKINYKSRGLGDTIEKITIATGIKKAFDKIAEKKGDAECTPCQKRKEALNKMHHLPYCFRTCFESVLLAYASRTFSNMSPGCTETSLLYGGICASKVSKHSCCSCSCVRKRVYPPSELRIFEHRPLNVGKPHNYIVKCARHK